MIAPLREPPRSGPGVQNEPLRIARRIVAAALLPRNTDTDCATEFQPGKPGRWPVG